MIEPDKQGEPSKEPVNDELTNMVKIIYEQTIKLNYAYRGFYTTKHGEHSDNSDHILPNSMITNSLCVYYVQYYRSYIPVSEIDKIKRIYNQLK